MEINKAESFESIKQALRAIRLYPTVATVGNNGKQKTGYARKEGVSIRR